MPNEDEVLLPPPPRKVGASSTGDDADLLPPPPKKKSIGDTTGTSSEISLPFGYETLDAAIAAMPKEDVKLPKTETTPAKTDATNVAPPPLNITGVRDRMKQVRTTEDFNAKYGTDHNVVEMVTGHNVTHDTPEKAKDAGIVKEATESAMAGLDMTHAMVLSLPNMLYNTFALPVNAALEMAGKEGNIKADPAGLLAKSAQFYRDRAEATLAEQRAKYDKSISDEFNEGDKGKAIQQLANSIIQMLPPMMAMAGAGAAGAGAAAVETGAALGFGSEKYNEIKDAPISEATKMGNALANGMLMSMFNKWSMEKMTIPVAKVLTTKGKDAAAQVAKETFEETYKAFFKKLTPVTAPLHSGISFAAVGFATNVIDRVTGVDPNRELDKGLSDMFIEGLALGAGTHAGTRIMNREAKEKVGALLQETDQIKQDANKQDIPQEAKDVLLNTYSEKMEQLNIELDKDRQNALKYSEEERKAVDDLSEQVERNNTVLSDPNVSPATKAIVSEKTELLNGEIDKLNKTVEKRELKMYQGSDFMNETGLKPGYYTTDQVKDAKKAIKESAVKVEPVSKETKEATVQHEEGAQGADNKDSKAPEAAAVQDGVDVTLTDKSNNGEPIEKTGDAVTEKDQKGLTQPEPNEHPLVKLPIKEDEVNTFPLLKTIDGDINFIPKEVAQKAWEVWDKEYATGQSLERTAQRGGFSHNEMDMFYPEWRAEVVRINDDQTPPTPEQGIADNGKLLSEDKVTQPEEKKPDLKKQLTEAKTEAKKSAIQAKIINEAIPEYETRGKATVDLSEKTTAEIENIELPDGDEGYKVTVKDTEGKEIDSRDFYEKKEVVDFLAKKQKGYDLSKEKKEVKVIEKGQVSPGMEVPFSDNAGLVVSGKVESVNGDEVKIKTASGVIYTRTVEDLHRSQVLGGLKESKEKIDAALALVEEPDKKKAVAAFQSSILPVKEMMQGLFKGANAVQDITAKGIEQAEAWVGAKVKEANTSQNDALRTIGQAVTSYANGLPRNNAELLNKRQLTGGIKLAQEHMAKTIQSLRELINNDLESMARVHEVLDPEFYTDEQGKLFGGKKAPIKYNDLTDTEKQLYNTLRSVLDYVHNYNFAMEMIDAKTYNKHKDKYTPRLYESFEVPEDVQAAIDEHNKYTGKKLNTSIFNKRQEITDEMRATILKDPIYATAKRLMQTEVNASVLSYLSHVAADPKLVSTDAQKGFVQLNGKGYGPLNGKYVPNYIAEDLRGYFFANNALDLVYNAFKIYDRTQLRQLVKKSHTVWDPGVQLGNLTSNFVFAFMGGLDPVTYASNLRKAAKEVKSKGAIYELLIKNGIIGTDVVSADLLPLTPAIKEAQDMATQPSILRKVLGKIDDVTMKLYEGTDNNAKVSAYMGFREYGYTEAEAIQRVYDSFQNYSTVGKIWDAASKTPVFGNAYVKFQADLQRILKNAALKRPLTTAMYAGMIYTLGKMASSISCEDEKHKALREGRQFIPKIDLGVAQIPLMFQTPAGEVNLARYLSPYYLYDVSETPIESWSKMLPYKVKYTEGPAKGVFSWFPGFTTDDPLAGVWVAAAFTDRDFRGKSIMDPLSTRYRMSGLTTTEKALNSINYIARSQFPYYDLGQDMYLATTGGTDFYGRQKNGWQALLSKVVKMQDFGPLQYAQTIEKKLLGFKYSMEGLEQQAKDVDTTILKELETKHKLYTTKQITAAQFDKIVADQMENRMKRKAEVLEKMAKVQQEFNEYTEQYKEFLPNK